MGTQLMDRIQSISRRSRLNQNLIIDEQGLRIGRKVLIDPQLLPRNIVNSSLSFCIAMRGSNPNLSAIIDRLNQDQAMLKGSKTTETYFGVQVASQFSRILFVAPDFKRFNKFVSPPLGLERIAAFLRNQNTSVDIEILDPNLLPDREIFFEQDYLLNRGYDIIGFSTLTPTLKNDTQHLVRIAGQLKAGKKPIFVMGNFGVLLGAEKLFSALPQLDLLFWGAGEQPMLTLLQDLQQSASISQTSELAKLFNALSNKHPEAIATRSNQRQFYPGRRFPAITKGQLDELQVLIDYYAIRYETYWTTYAGLPEAQRDITFHTSNTSCPMRCLFCATPKGALSFVAIDQVVAMFEHARLAYPEVHYFSFTDDNLFIRNKGKKQIERIASAISASSSWNESLTFYYQARANSFGPADITLMKKFSSVGFRDIAIGVESFSDTTLIELNKGSTAEEAQQAVSILTNNGFSPVVNLILFPPNITLKALADTIGTAMKLSRNPKTHIDPNFALLAYSGAPLTKKKEGSLLTDKDQRIYKLEQPWIDKTRVEYETVNINETPLAIPDRFSIIRPLLDQLRKKSEELSIIALEKTETKHSDQGRRGLMILWSIITIVKANQALFKVEAGEDTRVALSAFAGMIDLFPEVIKSRYPDEEEKILIALRQITNIPKL